MAREERIWHEAAPESSGGVAPPTAANASEGRPLSEENTGQSAQRRAKLAELRARGQAYPNDFRPDPRGPVAPVGQHSTRGVWKGNYIR